MPRPQKLTLDFYLHDANARNDRKIKSLRRRHGNDGYAAYFCILEMLCQEDGMKLNLSNMLDLENAVEECALRDEAHFYKILQTCIDIGLFDRQLWESDRIVFSHGLHNRYLKRLEERKDAAERKRRSVEAKNLQKRIDAVVAQDSQVITRDNKIGTRDKHPDIQNSESRTQNSELRTQNTHLDALAEQQSEPEESVSAFVSLTEPESRPPSVNPPQQRLEQSSAAPRYLSGAEKVNRHFAAPQMPWGDSLNPDPAFLNYLLKVYLPKAPSNKDKELSLSDARRWLNGAKYDEQRRDNALIEWESFQEWRDRPSDLNPADWEHSPKRAEYEALYNSMSLREFLVPNLEQGDRTIPPDRQSFYNYLQKIGAA